MKAGRQVGLLLLVGGALLVSQSMFSPILAAHPWMPNVLVPMIVLLSLTPSIAMAQGATASFCLGYLADSLSGNSMSAHTFVLVLMFVLARAVGSRLSFRGLPVQLAFTFVLTACTGALLWMVRLVFGTTSFSVDSFPLYLLLANAVTTALFAPLVFAIVRPILSTTGKQREEGRL